MRFEELLERLFPLGSDVVADGPLVSGEGRTASGPVAIAGTRGGPTLGTRELLFLSGRFLAVMRETPGRPILMLVDNRGQTMALEEEVIGLGEYVAHCVKAQDLARRRGHRVIALIHGNSVAGGFIAFGLCAGRTYALPDAETSVMALPAVARVTKMPLERLEELARTIPVFAPGVENFLKVGGLHGIWEGDLNARLEEALREEQEPDLRVGLGERRGGRPAAAAVVRRIADGR